jgi:hypothetical protein
VSGHFQVPPSLFARKVPRYPEEVVWAVRWTGREPRTFRPIDILGTAVSAHQKVSQQQAVTQAVTYNARNFNTLRHSGKLVVTAVEVVAVIVVVKSQWWRQ